MTEPTVLHADVSSVLSDWPAPDLGQSALRHAYLGFLAARPDATWRSCEPGHITASAVLLSADRRQVLLTLHPRVGRWVQLGGHCEPGDSTIAAAALREATEESGIRGLVIDPVPVHLDVHPITCSLGVATRHFDVRFLVTAPAGAVPAISAESDDLKFFPVNELPPDADAGVLAAIAAASARQQPATGLGGRGQPVGQEVRS
jgi:8-oxo-dGTP pyrophosphatase MutT (NUDIX family)